MTIETEVASLTTQTTALLTAVNVAKSTLDQKVTDATTQAGLATTNGAAQVALAATQAGLATTNGAAQVALATAQAVISTTKAGESSASAATATTKAADAEAARAAAVVAQNNAVSVVTGGTGSLTAAPGKLPLAAADGQVDVSWYAAMTRRLINDVGVPGQAGYGVGICPAVPAGYTPLAGCTDKLSANYGNYQYSDGSIMVWIPAFWFRLGHVNNPSYGTYGVNSVYTVPIGSFADDATANAQGFYRHRAFVNAGANQLGFFRDKYDCSQNGTIASSIALAMPMVSGPSSEAATATVNAKQYTVLTIGTTDYALIGGVNTVGSRFTATGAGTGTGTVSQQIGFVGCTANGQTPANFYYGALQAARSRGNKFFAESVFVADALCRLTEAHAQAGTSTTYCAWYDAAGVKNFPKGNNNNALKDGDDLTVTFTSAGSGAYPAFALAGSGSTLAKTTHNGQACGVSDVNGNIYKINTGMTCIATSKAITGATQANPVVLTVVAHGRTTGDVVLVESVAGMTQITTRMYKVTVLGVDSVSLDGVDGTAFSLYTAGGALISGVFYSLKASVDIAAVTSGASSATDHWGATGVAAQFDAVPMNFATTYPNNGVAQRYGNAANAVFSMATAADRARSMLGMPAADGMSTAGSNLMGLDYYYQYVRDQLCVISRGYWGSGSVAGSRFRLLNNSRTDSDNSVGFAAASYL